MDWIKDYTDSDTHPQMVKAGRQGREIFRFLCRLSGAHDLGGVLPPEYLTPGFLISHIGIECCQGCPVPVTTHVTDAIQCLTMVGLLRVVDGGNYQIDGWLRKQPGLSNAERQRRFKSKRKRVTSALPKVTAGNALEETRREETRRDSKDSVPPGPSVCELVFEYWGTTLKHQRAILDQKRRKLLDDRVREGMTLEEGKAVVDGSLIDAMTWPERAKFNGIDYLFENRSSVEKFAGLARAGPPKPKVDVRRGLQRSEDQGWTTSNYVDPEKFRAELAGSK
jgi:hypothetical protein